MGKYQYTIKIVSVKSIEHLEIILNEYAKKGFRVISVAKTDHVLYEGNIQKYTIYMEEKVKNE
jgi:hypothetical protein